mgnify:FL=1
MKVSPPKDDKLSTLYVNLEGVGEKYIIDLLTEKRDKVLRSFIVDKDCKLTFPYLTAGKYCLRMTEDKNRNGLVDTGVLLEHKQPEKVLLYKLEDGQQFITIPEMCELEQTINLSTLFN